MLNEKDQLEADALAISHAAVGALCAALRERGHNISEATAGRLLCAFNLANYTQKAGFQGRILAAAGVDAVNKVKALIKERRNV